MMSEPDILFATKRGVDPTIPNIRAKNITGQEVNVLWFAFFSCVLTPNSLSNKYLMCFMNYKISKS